MSRNPLRTASLFALTGAFALAACQSEEPETALEVDAQDMSGELIATPADEEAVDVDLPETPMTPVASGAPGVDAAPMAEETPSSGM